MYSVSTHTPDTATQCLRSGTSIYMYITNKALVPESVNVILFDYELGKFSKQSSFILKRLRLKDIREYGILLNSRHNIMTTMTHFSLLQLSDISVFNLGTE